MQAVLTSFWVLTSKINLYCLGRMFYLVALVLKTLGLFHLVVQSTVATCSDDRKVFWNTTYGILSDGPTNYNSNER